MVTKRLSNALLLSWSTQKFLGILPTSWLWELHTRSTGLALRKLCNDPNPVKIAIPEWPPRPFSTRMREVCEAYSNVLVEELKTGEKMYTPPMEVRLREGYQGFICKKPRATPLHWKEHINKEIAKLLREGVSSAPMAGRGLLCLLRTGSLKIKKRPASDWLLT